MSEQAITTSGDGNSGAVLSECGEYRYRLWRRWSNDPTMIFIMLNPSTADHAEDDPTIRRCISFAKREGCGGISVVNLFALRTTHPKNLNYHADPVGQHNDRFLADALSWPKVRVVAGWGAHPLAQDRLSYMLKTFSKSEIECIGRTKFGAPRHPLYLKSCAPLEPWTPQGWADGITERRSA